MRLVSGVRALFLKLLDRPSDAHPNSRALIVALIPEGIGAALSGCQSAVTVLSYHDLRRAIDISVGYRERFSQRI